MRKLLTLMLAVLLVGLFAAVVYAAVGAGDESTVGTTETSPTTGTTETTTTEDRPAHRHRGHHRHRHHNRHVQGTTAPTSGVDVSGPCDEAEHANDPRCTGVQPRVEDNQAQVVPHDIGDDHGNDRGAIDDRGDDNSGPGRVADDFGHEDDHSGSGHGGDDSGGDDNSGHGGGGDDD